MEINNLALARQIGRIGLAYELLDLPWAASPQMYKEAFIRDDFIECLRNMLEETANLIRLFDELIDDDEM